MFQGLFIDGFAGGGGASTGIAQAIGRDVDIALNHSESAIAIHKANHPDTSHYCQDIRAVWPRGVVIESTDALKLMKRMDSPGTLHFVDPPYLPETRSQGNRRRGAGFHVYTHELSLEDHVRMLDILKTLAGMVVLCGYPSNLYDESLVGWRRVERGAYADGGRARTEVVWINPAAVAALEHGPLFA